MTTTCQPAIAAANHKRKNKKTWTSKEWKTARESFLKEHGRYCDWCGETTYLTIHHPHRNVYGKDTYLDLNLSGCIVLCRACHSATHAGMVICEGKHDDGERHYRYHDADMCSYCFKKLHPEVVEAAKNRQREQRKKRRELQKKAAAKAKEWKKKNGVK